MLAASRSSLEHPKKLKLRGNVAHLKVERGENTTLLREGLSACGLQSEVPGYC